MDAALIASAFGAGLLSFFSPCIVPLLPVYVGLLTTDANSSGLSRTRRVGNTVAFVLGICITFVLLGVGAGALGSVVDSRPLALVCGILIFLFGLYLAGIVSIPALARERRVDLSRIRVRSTLGALLLGIGFSFGWTPCVGPIMGTILALSAEAGSAVAGGLLMFVYGLGMSVPFVAITLASDVALAKVRGLQKHLPALQRIGGILIAVMGIWMIATQIPQATPTASDAPAASSEASSEASSADSPDTSEGGPTAEDLIGAETTEAQDADTSGYSTAWRNVVLTDTDGATHRFSELKGTPVYFEFWGTWCSECVANMDAYAALAREHNDAGDVRVVSVFTPGAYGERDAAGIAEWLAERNADFPVWLDTNQSLGTYLRLRAFPTSVFVNSDGSIAKVRIGVIEHDELEQILASLH